MAGETDMESSDDSLNETSSASDKPLYCAICDKQFKRKNNLHMLCVRKFMKGQVKFVLVY